MISSILGILGALLTIVAILMLVVPLLQVLVPNFQTFFDVISNNLSQFGDILSSAFPTWLSALLVGFLSVLIVSKIINR